LFVTVEGPEGAGKTTQLATVAETLRDLGDDVVVTREPGGTPVGEALRALVLGGGGAAVTARAEALLYAAARAQHVETLIRPALAGGRTVVCDRFTDSSIAYQGGGRGLDAIELITVQNFATGGLRPDLKLLLDLPVEVGLARRLRGGEEVNHVDREDLAFHRRVHAMYHRLVVDAPNEWVVIDASGVPSEVSAQIRQRLGERLRRFARVP